MARSESDSWNLATSVGVTATMVAAQRALAAAGPEPLIDDPTPLRWCGRSASTCTPGWWTARFR